MGNENQQLILKIMLLSEAKANIETVDAQFSKVRHLLDDVIEELAGVGELGTDIQEEYKQVETEIFHVTKVIEKIGFEIRGRKRNIKNDMCKILEE